MEAARMLWTASRIMFANWISECGGIQYLREP
jgi:hypothetical protein